MTVQTTATWRRRWVVALAAGVLTLAACGGESDDPVNSTDSQSTDAESVESQPTIIIDTEESTPTTSSTTTTEADDSSDGADSDDDGSGDDDADDTTTTTEDDMDEGTNDTTTDTTDDGEAAEVPRFLDADTSNGRYTMAIDQSATLTLAPGLLPKVDGDSVIVFEQVNVAGSENSEWEVRAVAVGTSVLTVDGTDIDWEIEVAR